MRTPILWFTVCLLLLTFTGCQKQQGQSDVQLPEPTVTKKLPETVQEEPTKEPKQPTEAEMPAEELTPEEKQTLHERLFYATVCTCRMEDSARWHLLDLGIEMDAPGEDFSGAMDAFERALYAYPADTFTENTFWLIDTKLHGLELQFWKYDANGHPGRLSCVAAFYWEPGMEDADLLGEDLLLYTLDWAFCTKDASEAERTRVQEQYERLLPDFPSGTGWRVSMAPDGKMALMALDPERGGEIFYACGQVSGPMIWNSEDCPSGTNDELYCALVSVAFDEGVIAENQQIFLRGFLAFGLYADDLVLWDGACPFNTFNDVYLAYDLRRACMSFLEELRADETEKNAFLTSEPWTLFYDGGAEFHLTNEAGERVNLSAPLS